MLRPFGINMNVILSKQTLQRDIGELLDYLHTTPEDQWDMNFLRKKIMINMKRFNENIVYYHTPTNTNDYIKLIYSRADVQDLIRSLTDKYTAIGKLKIKEQYRSRLDTDEED